MKWFKNKNPILMLTQKWRRQYQILKVRHTPHDKIDRSTVKAIILVWSVCVCVYIWLFRFAAPPSGILNKVWNFDSLNSTNIKESTWMYMRGDLNDEKKMNGKKERERERCWTIGLDESRVKYEMINDSDAWQQEEEEETIEMDEDTRSKQLTNSTHSEWCVLG